MHYLFFSCKFLSNSLIVKRSFSALNIQHLNLSNTPQTLSQSTHFILNYLIVDPKNKVKVFFKCNLIKMLFLSKFFVVGKIV